MKAIRHSHSNSRIRQRLKIMIKELMVCGDVHNWMKWNLKRMFIAIFSLFVQVTNVFNHSNHSRNRINLSIATIKVLAKYSQRKIQDEIHYYCWTHNMKNTQRAKQNEFWKEKNYTEQEQGRELKRRRNINNDKIYQMTTTENLGLSFN